MVLSFYPKWVLGSLFGSWWLPWCYVKRTYYYWRMLHAIVFLFLYSRNGKIFKALVTYPLFGLANKLLFTCFYFLNLLFYGYLNALLPQNTIFFIYCWSSIDNLEVKCFSLVFKFSITNADIYRWTLTVFFDLPVEAARVLPHWWPVACLDDQWSPCGSSWVGVPTLDWWMTCRVTQRPTWQFEATTCLQFYGLMRQEWTGEWGIN